MKIRVADYIVQKLYDNGGEHVFLVTGGMIMHLTDALVLNKKVKFTCCHHEQAVTMAAEAYGRMTNKLGVAFATAGPGALNTITGIVGAFVDNSPCVIVGGQSKLAHAVVTGPRQFALQGFDNLGLIKNITKYAVMLTDLSRVKYEVEKAIFLAKQHRVGPVYIECPIDIQAMSFDPDQCVSFDPKMEGLDKISIEDKELDILTDKVVEALLKSKRPCLVGGAGIRLSDAVELFHEFAEKTGSAVLTSRLGMDLIGDDHPNFIGRPGTYGDRPANLTIQNCDLLITVGSRMGIGLIGYGNPKEFATEAYKINVDIDEQELNKPALNYDLKIKADARVFFEKVLSKLNEYKPRTQEWLSKTKELKRRYPVDVPEYEKEIHGINSYHFTRLLSERMPNDAVFVCDTGSCFHVFAQAFKTKFGQRHIITGGLSTMGYAPASIGVARANNGKDVYCISGDGSIQMNIQEFETIAYNKLKVKTIIYNNDGYLLIRHTQKNFCEGRLMGEGSKTGVGFPNMEKIANAYGIHFIRINNSSEFDSKVNELVTYNGPVICEVINPREQLLIPRVSSKKLEDGTMMSMSYDDMFPFLSREEYDGVQKWLKK